MSHTKLEYAIAWKRNRDVSDEAFHSGDAALSTGAALTASRIATQYRSTFGLKSTDDAVAEMRQLLKRK